PQFPRGPDTARRRGARQQRMVTIVALVLLLAAAGVGYVVLRDYQANVVVGEYRIAIVRAEEDIASARRVASASRPDLDRARARLLEARTKLDAAARSPVADQAQIDRLRAEIALLDDQFLDVAIDLARIAAGAKPTQLAASENGLYAADPGAGRLWRIHGEGPLQTGVVLERGQQGVGAPVAVATQEAVVLSIDDGRRVWRAEGNTVANVTPPDAARWGSLDSLATAFGNLYVLDAASGQVWRHEPSGARFGQGSAVLAAPLPPNTARSLAVDGDIWVVAAGEVLRFRRSPAATTAARVAFTPRWQSGTVRPAAIQALESQRFLYLLDAAGKHVIQMTREGVELARFALPAPLAEPTAFYVSEGQRLAYTLHGSKLVVTDISR
ncbi:MAG: hypothetical protein ACRDF0_11200, partial [Candidatus Limnocylindria bacterium]